jgi:class 3 adenylate cyclase
MGKVMFDEKVILFCDIHNFSKIMIEIGNRYPRFIQSYYSKIGEDIVAAGGRIVKYMGDAILAVFDRDKEIQAIKCANKMRNSYLQILNKQKLKVLSELEVGINSGKVSCGEFGHNSLKAFDVFGPVVNEAAIIMHYRGIAITERVRLKLNTSIKLKELPRKKLKWQKAPLQRWAVLTTKQSLPSGLKRKPFNKSLNQSPWISSGSVHASPNSMRCGLMRRRWLTLCYTPSN